MDYVYMKARGKLETSEVESFNLHLVQHSAYHLLKIKDPAVLKLNGKKNNLGLHLFCFYILA